ncbi:MAG: hypothetical protein US40_C0007G0042 [Candidatus Roizmanbacteria bacterium GW2011_GWC2_37_13]|uniref:Uncharacterized protein n=1 Tax=Candidatus Roizmanbacteria bacterium GW2011_GWC2_37_13 TaxID=1618486 RepID=A0A0G0G2Y1_9BACT|nr:MAG: hypothetical protein US38_C0012G0045 [Candidatus Roizmanbacteria bacterium GW2011_GWC1_37_12]KKQ25543.1 MAG: hypothetical protein US40_C0007G0042 [Candidatus Roizmanbacteria bacterium GW2011_GWC2_37_13]
MTENRREKTNRFCPEKKEVMNMMKNWAYGNYGGMMAGFQFWGLLTWVALLVFLVLGSVYFWKQIKKNK